MRAKLWQAAGVAVDLSSPVIMGILNVTPDSFSDGGEHDGFEAALAHARRMREEGAAIIDVGGESTRPGSSEVSIAEELARVLPVTKALVSEGFLVSVDTRHAEVAAAALEAGAQIINDVSGFRDAAMREVVAAAPSKPGVVVMHMLGEPRTMQANPHYEDVVAEVEAYLLAQAAQLEAAGVARERICIDPGVGFGKTVEHNLALLAHQGRLAQHGYPLMVAVSRKSVFGAVTGIAQPAARDEHSALAAAAACAHGAQVARVHNVPATQAALANSREANIALGSNIEPRVERLHQAFAAISQIPHTWLTRRSSIYESEPAYKEDQAPFANAVCTVQTTLTPEALLENLQRIEREQGRERHERFGPRTLDLDLLTFQGEQRQTERLTLPHPRLHERDFTLTPLRQLHGEWPGTPKYGTVTCVLEK